MYNFDIKTDIFEEKVIRIKRVTKVVKGGKILSIQATAVVGNRNGKVGVGMGRGDDATVAISKAVENAKKELISVFFTKNFSISHLVKTRYNSSTILLKPAASGTGIIAGGIIRTVLELAGIKNIFGKQFGSNDKLNIAKGTIKALKTLSEEINLNSSLSTKQEKFYEKNLKS